MRRAWLALTIGSAGLLVVMLAYGIFIMGRTRDIYDEIQQVQQRQERILRPLSEISEHLYQISVTVRDHLLDTSPANASLYEKSAHQYRQRIQELLGDLQVLMQTQGAGPLQRLREEFDTYWAAVQPVFGWTGKDKLSRGTFFLRQQQRPRRTNLLAITGELKRLSDTSFEAQYNDLRRHQEEFQQQFRRTLALSLLLGALVAAGSVWRIGHLERRARKHQEATEAAERELRHLSNRLMSAQEEERKAISRELHDEVGQLLTGLRIELGSVERSRLAEDRFQEHLGEAKSLAERTMRTVRDLAVGLRPSVLDDLGLGPALQWQAREFKRRTGRAVRLDITSAPEDLADPVRTCVYRIVQEALTNCAKHSDATEIRVSLSAEGSRLALAVQDNGKGLPKSEGRRGLGLLGIEERVRELGGHAEWTSQPGQGATLQVTLPFHQNGS